jgi:translation initiation factor IF-1
MKTKNLEFSGTVVSIQPNANYVIKINHKGTEFFALCYLCGKMTKHFINPEIGDAVKVEISPFDLNNGDKIKGRIIQRMK